MRRQIVVVMSILALAIGQLSCGGAQSGGGGRPSGDHEPAFENEQLPNHLSWVRFGETTLEEARGHFTADNLYVTDSIDSTMGGERENLDRTRGANAGIRFSRLAVTRSTNADGYVGELGDDYGNISFYFARFPGSETPTLYRLEVAQRPGGTPNVCDPARAFGESPAALEGCSERVVLNPRMGDDGAFFFCGGTADGEIPFTIQCRAGSGESMGPSVRYEVVVPGVTPPE